MTALGMGFIILGIIIIAIGWNASPRNGKLLGCGALFTFGGMFIGIGGNPAKDMPNGSPSMVVFGFILVVLAVVWCVIQFRAAKEKHATQAAQAAEADKIAFYKECLQNGITDCRNEKEVQKATLIAQKKKILFTSINTLFLESKVLYEKSVASKAQAALDSQKEKERTLCANLERYSNLSGRDKRIAYLSAERAEALSSAQTLRSGASALMGASQQKELDWAVFGGIADGLAGPAAGVSTALDIQAKNAQIRAQNKANLDAIAPIMMTSYEGASKHERRAAELQAEIDATMTKLIGKETPAKCLDYISFANTAVEVSETGTCTITTTASPKKPILIFDDVSAVVDGTLIAKIYDGKTLVGTASLVLPKYGLQANTKLTGMSLFCGQKGKSYSVEFAGVNLWTMER